MVAPLPGTLGTIDIADLVTLSPAALLLDPSPLLGRRGAEVAARSLRYARSSDDDSYDAIGFRAVATAPQPGTTPMQTFEGARLGQQRATARRADPLVDELREQQVRLRHRALTVPLDGRFRFDVRDRVLELVRIEQGPDGRESEEPWPIALSYPPEMLLRDAVDADAPVQVARHLVGLRVPGAHWLPLTELVAAGRFARMQEVAGRLVADTDPDRCHLFVSHRWLSPAQPDPDGRQARFVAWQIVAHLAQAIRVARRRGLHQPRLSNPQVGFVIGLHGSRLAEVLLVNVLRPALTDETLAEAWDEVLRIDRLVSDHGLQAAADDEGLRRLRAVLDESPVLRSLLAKILVWYDYSCLPQPPRTPHQQTLFRQGLDSLVTCQMLGHTLILLDDAEDYLQRAWCTLEALVADHWQRVLPVVGGPHGTSRHGEVEIHFTDLMEDRPHLVWRALLDTEVFGVQTSMDCLRRLRLDATDPADLPFVYARLREQGAPTKIHIDPSELVTGVLPLPCTPDGGHAVAVLATDRRADEEVVPIASLDWSGWVELGTRPRIETAPLRSWLASGRGPGTHVAVVAACEGEAVLVADWVAAHRADLEQLLDVRVVSLSWLASDVVPVGHFVEAALRAAAVPERVWVLVGHEQRLLRSEAVQIIVRSAAAASVTLYDLDVGKTEGNVRRRSPGTERGATTVPVPADGFPRHEGGLFLSDLVHELLSRDG